MINGKKKKKSFFLFLPEACRIGPTGYGSISGHGGVVDELIAAPQQTPDGR
jgi:hypothetical protein